MVKFTFFSVRPGYEAGDWTALISLMKHLHHPLTEIRSAMEMAIIADRYIRSDENKQQFVQWIVTYNDDDSISFFWIVDNVTGAHEDDPFFEIQFV